MLWLMVERRDSLRSGSRRSWNLDKVEGKKVSRTARQLPVEKDTPKPRRKMRMVGIWPFMAHCGSETTHLEEWKCGHTWAWALGLYILLSLASPLRLKLP
jgi:hypothetical protein